MELSNEEIKNRVKSLKREVVDDFLVALVSNPYIKPYLFLKKQIEDGNKFNSTEMIDPLSEDGEEKFERITKYYKRLKELGESYDFMQEKLGLANILLAEEEIKKTPTAVEAATTYEDILLNNKKPK